MPPRSRNFNGCWTCRMRKIKCDAVQPKCLRCQKANLECKGYGLMLAWADVSTVDDDSKMVSLILERQPNIKKENGALRRNVELVKFPRLMLYETYDRLNHIVTRLDDVDHMSTRNCFVVGPFGVFPSRNPPRTSVSHKPVSVTHLRDTFLSDVLESDLESSIFSTTKNAYVHKELVEFAKLAIMAIKGPRHKFNAQGMFHILYPNFFPNVESDNWRPNGEILSTFFSQDERNNNMLIAPPMSSTFRLFTESVLSSMRVAHGLNPWKRLVVPYLKQLFFEIVCEEYPESKGWNNHIIRKSMARVPRDLLLRNMKFAIFCMCLSISWHECSLSGVQVRNSMDTFFVNDDLKISIELRKIAVNILNYHLDEYDTNSNHYPEDDYDSCFILALILQVHLDNLFGIFENYELMYAIGDFILKKPKKRSRYLSSLERHLRHNFNILNILYESTRAINFFNYSTSDGDQKLKYLDFSENYDLTAHGPNREGELASDEIESDFDINYNDDDDDDCDDQRYERTINVPATSLTSQGLPFTVHFKGDKTLNVANRAQVQEQPKNPVFKSFQRGFSERSPLLSPEIPSLDDGTIFLSYGLPKALLQLVQEAVHLTNHENLLRTRGLAPRNFPRICAETEDKILNFNVENYWKLYDNEYNSITNVATKTFISEYHEGLYHNVAYFHNALIVYFNRLIPESPIATCQAYIESSFFHLEKLVALNNSLRKKGNDLSFHPLFWPLLVCGSDIDLRTHGHLKERCQRLWKEDCFHRLNYWRSKQILFEIWHRREKDGENNSFMDMIREWAIVLSLG